MPKQKTRYPLESFGPALMQALLRGSREKLVLKFKGDNGVGKKLAHNFHRRIHTLRSRMRNENHPDYMVSTRARVAIFWGERAIEHGAPQSWADDDQGRLGAIIVIRPQDEEFASVLHDAGIGPATAPTPEPIVITPTALGIDPLEDLLSELGNIPNE